MSATSWKNLTDTILSGKKQTQKMYILEEKVLEMDGVDDCTTI